MRSARKQSFGSTNKSAVTKAARKRAVVVAAQAAALAMGASSHYALGSSSGTWIGGGADGSWSTTGNWQAGVVPGVSATTGDADTATFSAATGQSNVIIDNNRGIGSIIFDGSAQNFVIGSFVGVPLTLGSSGGAGTVGIASTFLGTTATETINAPINFATGAFSYTFANSASSSNVALVINSAVPALGGGTSVITLRGTNTGANVFEGSVSNSYGNGPTSFTKTDAGHWIISGLDATTGNATISGGSLELGGSTTLQGDIVAVNVANGLAFSATIPTSLQGASQTTSGLTLANIGAFTIGGLGGGSTFALNDTSGAGITLAVGTNENNFGATGSSFGGTVTGQGGITKTGIGTQALTAISSTYTGITTISQGTLTISVLGLGGSGSSIGASTSAAGNLVLNGGALSYSSAAGSTTDRLFTIGLGNNTIDDTETTGVLGSVTFNNTGTIGYLGSGARSLTITGIGQGVNTLDPSIGDSGGATSLIKNGTTEWILGGTNSYSGGTTINQGILQFSALAAIPTSGKIQINNGGILTAAGAYTTAAGYLGSGSISTTSTGALALTTSETGDTLDFSSYPTLMLGAFAPATFTGDGVSTGTITTTMGGTFHLGGGGSTLTVAGTPFVNGTSLVVGALAATLPGLDGKFFTASAGTVALSGTDSVITGSTTLNTGALNLTTFAGALPSSAITAFNGTTLGIDSSSGTAAASVTRAASLTLNNATATVAGTSAGNTDDVITGSIAFNSGTSRITITPNATKSAELFAAGFTRTAGQGVALINGNALGNNVSTNVAVLALTTAPALVGTTAGGTTGINASVQNTQIVPYLVGEATSTTGGTGTATGTANTFLTYNATTGLRPLNPTQEFTNNAITSGNNTRITALTTATGTGSVTINSLVLAGGSLSIADGGTLNNASGAILFASSGNIVPTTSTGDLDFTGTEAVISANSGNTGTISSPISGNTGLTKAGVGTLDLTATNTYTGTTTIQSGIMVVGNASALGADTSAVKLGAATLTTTAVTFARPITILADNTGVATLIGGTDSGTVTLGTGSGAYHGFTLNGGVVSGVIQDPITLSPGVGAPVTVTGGTLSGSNTFSGGVLLNSGALTVNNTTGLGTGSLYINGGSISTSSGLTLNNGIVLNNSLLVGTSGTTTLGGSITLTGNRLIESGNGGNQTTIVQTGAIGDGGNGYGLIFGGSGSNNFILKLSGLNTFSGGITAFNNLSGSNRLQIGNLGTTTAASGFGTGTLTLFANVVIDNTSGAGGTVSTINPEVWDGNFAFQDTVGLNMGTGAVTMNAPIQISVRGTVGTFSIGGNISDGGKGYGIVKLNLGTLALAGTNNFSGVTSVVSQTTTGGVVTTGGVLLLSNTNALENSTVQVQTGSVVFNSSVSSHAFNFGGLTGNNAFGLTDSGSNPVALTVGGQTVNVTSSYGGILSGGGSLTKVGSGTLTLTGSSTYSGGTSITAGTLMVNNTTGSGTGTGSVTITGTGALGGTGIISGDISTGDGKIRPGPGGNSTGNLTAAGNVTLDSHATISFALLPTASPLTDGTTNDVLTMTGTSKTFTPGSATLQLIPVGFTGAPFTPVTYTIVNGGVGTTIAMSSIFSNLGSLESGTAGSPGAQYAYSSNGVVADVTFNSNNIQVQLDSAPEPSCLGLLSLGAVGMLRRRRRRMV